jgi:hypothetical protein
MYRHMFRTKNEMGIDATIPTDIDRSAYDQTKIVRFDEVELPTE